MKKLSKLKYDNEMTNSNVTLTVRQMKQVETARQIYNAKTNNNLKKLQFLSKIVLDKTDEIIQASENSLFK
jgi:hypothetical protein